MPTRNFRELIDAMPPARQKKLEERFSASFASILPGELSKTAADNLPVEDNGDQPR